MTAITGSCSSKIQSNSMVIVQGSADHQVGLMVMVGKHSSPDPKWDGSTMTYVGTSDLAGGVGEHSDISTTPTRTAIPAMVTSRRR
jgi:hypothetical protein